MRLLTLSRVPARRRPTCCILFAVVRDLQQSTGFKGGLSWLNAVFILVLWCKHRSYAALGLSEMPQTPFGLLIQAVAAADCSSLTWAYQASWPPSQGSRGWRRLPGSSWPHVCPRPSLSTQRGAKVMRKISRKPEALVTGSDALSCKQG